MQGRQKVLVVGATGGTGRATVEALVRAGHEVTAFSRNASDVSTISERVRTINGDATNLEDVERAVLGHDAVIVTLGISENPLRVRLFGATRTPQDVRSAGTRNVIAAMRKHGVRRLVVQSSFGVGESRNDLRLVDRLVFNVLLKPQIADTEMQELEVRQSELDWVLARPVHLTADDDNGMPFASAEGKVQQWKVSRKNVATFLAQVAHTSEYAHQSVALSGGGVG